jgi:hypothetical protein
MTFQEDCKKTFKIFLDQLNRLVALDAPDAIIAQCFACLITTAEGAFGEDLYMEMLKKRLANHRQRMGYCQECDNEIPREMTHYLMCDKCNEGIDKWIDEHMNGDQNESPM